MNDQISRQKLMEDIKKWQTEAEPEEARVMDDIICLIEDQPTAYDVEAVVRELEAKSELYSCEAEADMDNGWEYLSNRKYGISAGLQKAIEIVRGGRNDSNT